MILYKYFKTAQITFRGQTNGGIAYLFPNVIVNLIYLLPLIFLWRVIAKQGVEVGMNLQQLLTYTYLNSLFSQMLVVRTFTSGWAYEGQLINLYARPVSIFGQIISLTVGGWVPMLLIYSLPMLLIAPLLGISLTPATPWFLISFILCVSLGFAVDFIFACITIRLRSMAWLAYSIRMAVVSLFSGTVVPFKILPFNLETIFTFQPFGSLGGAPLSLFVGTAEPFKILCTQLFWNLTLWPIAIIWFKKSKERQVSYGG